MPKTTEMSFSIKVNLGNFESMEVAQNISLLDNDDEKKCFAELVTSVQKKTKAVISMLGRENDCLIYKQLVNVLGNGQVETQQFVPQQTLQQVFNAQSIIPSTPPEFSDNPTLDEFISSVDTNTIPYNNGTDDSLPFGPELFGLESALNSSIPEL